MSPRGFACHEQIAPAFLQDWSEHGEHSLRLTPEAKLLVWMNPGSDGRACLFAVFCFHCNVKPQPHSFRVGCHPHSASCWSRSSSKKGEEICFSWMRVPYWMLGKLSEWLPIKQTTVDHLLIHSRRWSVVVLSHTTSSFISVPAKHSSVKFLESGSPQKSNFSVIHVRLKVFPKSPQ